MNRDYTFTVIITLRETDSTPDELYRATANIVQITEHLQGITRQIANGTHALPDAETGLRTDRMDGELNAEINKDAALKALSEATHALQTVEAAAYRAHNHLARLYIETPA